MRWYQLVWLSWVAFGVGFEIIVLLFKIQGATLSEQIWALRDRGSGFFSLLMFFLAWMIYHFIRERVGGHTLPPPNLPTP